MSIDTRQNIKAKRLDEPGEVISTRMPSAMGTLAHVSGLAIYFFPGPEFGEQEIDVRGLANDREDELRLFGPRRALYGGGRPISWR
jgi:hypothetical protein